MGANHVRMLNIIYLNGSIKGKYYYLYICFQSYTAGRWLEGLVKRRCKAYKRTGKTNLLGEKIYIRNMQKKSLVLHSDNRSPMKRVFQKNG